MAARGRFTNAIGDSDASRLHDPRPAVSAPTPAPGPAPDVATGPAPKETTAILALASVAFALNLNTNVLAALLPFVREALGLVDFDGPRLIAAAAFGSALGALAFGFVARSVGRRRTLLVSSAVFVVTSLLHAVPGPFGWLLGLRAVSGCAVGLAYAAASALSAEIVPYPRRGAAMGRFNAGMFLAIPVGMPLSVLLARLGFWPGIFVVQGVVAALGWWWAYRTVPAGERDAGAIAFGRVLRNRGALGGLLATGLHVGSFFTTVQLATSWLEQSGLLAKQDQMPLWVGFGLVSVVGTASLGRLSDVIGKRSFTMLTSAVLAAGFFGIAREVPIAVLVTVGAVLAAVAAARTGPLQALVSGQVPAQDLGVLMGLRGFVMQAGVGAFALTAALPEQRGGFLAVLWYAAAWQAASFLAIRLLVREGT
jgi:predicted MFS family arabinose efflux permease